MPKNLDPAFSRGAPHNLHRQAASRGKIFPSKIISNFQINRNPNPYIKIPVVLSRSKTRLG
jgi:hypothetical protein